VKIDELSKINGIGQETIKDIKKIYSSIEELTSAIKEDRVPLRNDIVNKLRKFLLS